ncbi:MAG: PepSY domain-containing protein, partial [Planctomycetota bacterium]
MPTGPKQKALNKWTRKLHRWGAIAIALPLAIVIGTGILLQLKKYSSWVQPPTQRGTGEPPTITFERILAIASTVPEAEIESWDDVDRLDVRPDKGVVKVRCRNRWEVQIDTNSGRVLQSTHRRSDLIET